MKKTLILASLCLITLLSLLLAETEENQRTDYTGIFKIQGDKFFLESTAGSKQLLMAPASVLDSLWMPEDGDSLRVVGTPRSNAILVAEYGDGSQLVKLRNESFEPLFDKVSTYIVNAASCIGCRLCVSNCPVGAITMQGRKAVIDQSKCVECGICISGNGRFRGCPVRAISK